MSKQILVHVDLKGQILSVGRLWIHERNRRESASFEYSGEWLSNRACFSLEPALHIGPGSFHTDKALFGSIGDSAPDRWGRNLMKRLEARSARKEKRPARHLKESDFLLMVNDFARQGALRFTMEGSSFLAPANKASVPPLVDLPRLLKASERFIENREGDEDIRDLVEPGSSLGGARPKAVVMDKDKMLIAKFPNKNDDWDVPAWEYLSLIMAKKAGIETPGFTLVTAAGRNVLLLERFDRDYELRIPFLSAMSMLGAADGEQRSYLEIGDALQQYGACAGKDLKELWRRIVFNIMISNVDDHLRNHGFLYTGQAGWQLSPIYDLEPTPAHIKDRYLSTAITETDGTASLDLAYEVAEEFGFKLSDAKQVALKIDKVTRDWQNQARRIGIHKREIEMMASAFEYEN